MNISYLSKDFRDRLFHFFWGYAIPVFHCDARIYTQPQKSEFLSDTFWYNSNNIILIKIVRLKCNTCRIFLHTFWVVIHCPYSPIVLWNHATCYEVRCKKIVAFLVNRPIALQCMTMKYWHKSAYTQWSALCRGHTFGAVLSRSATYYAALTRVSSLPPRRRHDSRKGSF